MHFLKTHTRTHIHSQSNTCRVRDSGRGSQTVSCDSGKLKITTYTSNDCTGAASSESHDIKQDKCLDLTFPPCEEYETDELGDDICVLPIDRTKASVFYDCSPSTRPHPARGALLLTLCALAALLLSAAAPVSGLALKPARFADPARWPLMFAVSWFRSHFGLS